MRTFLFYLVFLLSPVVASAQFQQCNSSTTKDLHDIYFINSSVGIAVGDSGIILRSTDGGLNWSAVLSIDSMVFEKVSFFDAQNGIAVGSSVFTTRDGGLNWVEQIHGDLWNNAFLDLAILNDSVCIISGQASAILRSSNKGLDWDTLVHQNNGELGNLSFVNDTLGFSCPVWGGMTTKIFVTLDGGANWDTIVNQGTATMTILEDMDFIDLHTGFQAGWYAGHLAKTIDGGQHWNPVHFTDSTIPGQMLDMDIRASRPNTYYASGWYGYILKSIDSGDNWSNVPNPANANGNSLYGIYFANDTLGWVVGAGGIIMRTQNGGGINLGNKEVVKGSGIRVFPNPVSNTLNIDFESAVTFPVQMQLIDIAGRVVTQKELTEKNNKLQLNNIPPGQYLLQCTAKEHTTSFKILVK